MTQRLRTLVAGSLLAVLAGVHPAAAATGDGAVAALNNQRAANGIPGGVVLNAAWSANCAQHNSYMRTNSALVHVEDPAAPGYTAGGAFIGPNAVLAFTSIGQTSWDANPWENAPYHLAQVLQPGLRSTGYDDNGYYSCMSTWPGVSNSGLGSKVFTYPGDQRTNVPPNQAANELPSTPQQAVGIAASATTGPNLLVFAHGLGGTEVKVTAASLTPSVPVKWVDNTTPNVGGLIPSGAILIPITPLHANTAYTASVALAGATSRTTYTWQFTTGGAVRASAAASPSTLRASFTSRGSRRIEITGLAGASPITLTVSVPKRSRKTARKTVSTAASGVFTGTVKAPAKGRATACAILGRLKLCQALKV